MTRIRVALVAGMIGVAGIAGSASTQQNPLDRLWNAILDLSARITTLENAPPSGPGGGGRPVVVDANGVVIGEVVDTTTTNTSAPGGATVLLTRQGILFPISVRKTTFRAPGPLFFTSTDCSVSAGGAAYIRDHDGVFPNLYVWSPGNTVYVQDRTVLPSNVTVHSASGFPGVCTQSTSTQLVYPAWPVTDLSAEFTPPYRVEMGQ